MNQTQTYINELTAELKTYENVDEMTMELHKHQTGQEHPARKAAREILAALRG